MKENFYMKKFKIMILALSLGVACVGNQIKLAADVGSQESVDSNFVQNFNLPTDDPSVGQASDMFLDVVMSRINFRNTGDLTTKFKNFANLVSDMAKNSKKYFSTVILLCPVISHMNESTFLNMANRERMIGSLLSCVYHNVDSVEWDIDVENHRGTVNFCMRNIPDDIRAILSFYSYCIQLQGNKISYSF